MISRAMFWSHSVIKLTVQAPLVLRVFFIPIRQRTSRVIPNAIRRILLCDLFNKERLRLEQSHFEGVILRLNHLLVILL